MEFLDREEERARLYRFLDGESGGFVCLYGRRRCGKSRLLRECVKGRGNCLYFTADRSEASAQIARFAQEAAVLYPAMRMVSGSDWGSVLDLWRVVAPKKAILVLDEFPYLVEKCPALPSILQRIVDQLETTGRKIVICGSSQRMMQGFVLKAGEPLYGRAREILPIRPLDFHWMRRAFPGISRMECLRRWAVWGGVPRYWELQSETKDLLGALRRHLSALGVLRHEPEFLLLDDVGDFAQASTVLAFIGAGAHRVSEIAGRMGRPATDLSRPLQRLTDLGLVVKELPFGAEGNSKKSLYRIADPFLDFWYAFVRPRWSREEFLEDAADHAVFETGFSAHLGKVWERLVRETLLRRGLPGDSRLWTSVGRWWGADCNHAPMEIDVVAESADGSTLLVGECKIRLSVRECETEWSSLQRRISAFPLASKYQTVLVRLFVAESAWHEAVTLEWALQ